MFVILYLFICFYRLSRLDTSFINQRHKGMATKKRDSVINRL